MIDYLVIRLVYKLEFEVIISRVNIEVWVYLSYKSLYFIFLDNLEIILM